MKVLFRNFGFLFVMVCTSLATVSFAQPFITSFSNNVATPIGPGIAFSNIVVPSGQPIVTRVRVKVDITFPSDGNLILQLVRVGIQSLSNQHGAGANFTNTVFGDFDLTPISAGTSPFTGFYIPDFPLAGENGQIPTGIWQLDVTNVGGVFSGTINSWSLEFNNIVLPVEMTSFSAVSGNEMVRLNWRTETESNNAHFNLYRSLTQTDRGDVVAQIAGHGSAVTQHSYSFIDNRVQNGTTYYYRIGDVDVNGIEVMHPMVVQATPSTDPARAVPSQFEMAQNYPNPFNPTTAISYSLPEAGMVHLSVFDVMGRNIATLVNGDQQAAAYRISFDGSKLPTGTYYYTLTTSNATTTKRMTLLK